MIEFLQANVLIPYIVAAIAFCVLVFFLFRKRSLKAKMIFLYSIWGVGLILLAVNKAFHFARGEHILAQLPLHLCYISLIFFIPAALRFKKKIFYDFIFYINAPGALMALTCPAKDYIDGMWSGITFTYVVFHVIIVCIPIWLFLWKIYLPKISVKNTAIIAGIFLVLSLAMYGLSALLVANGVTSANYFWLLIENARDNNIKILTFFASIIPYDYIYLAAFALPILIIYVCIWNTALRFLRKDKSPKTV